MKRPQSVHFNDDFCYLGRERLRSHYDEPILEHTKSDLNLSNLKVSTTGLLRQLSTSVRSLRKNVSSTSTETSTSTKSKKRRKSFLSKFIKNMLNRNSCSTVKKTKRRCSSSSMDFWEETYDFGRK